MAPLRTRMSLPLQLGDGLRLELRSRETIEAGLELTRRNLQRLREWEPWAQADQTLASARSFTELVLSQYAQGRNIPTLVFLGDEPIGSVSMRIDPLLGTGELGYWIDGDHEGRGIVTRACAALRDRSLEAGLARVEIRAATANTRSRRVAERLGFTLEGVLRSALPVGARRLDLAVYGFVAGDDARDGGNRGEGAAGTGHAVDGRQR
ncbi:GNAT family N-acetyltransferase [Herbiconiux daphne]|uniref:GNAT family N-acetyltransferase n=1 Tax=Herbiconiux daphne TaxID=2970914 RepID=A0ABT2H067_9MICO|nr:GNAT family N-acetyltransferase [Herbiconiux daphne]MCS5733272.1 GNAT family N-acetyltransferase [Herbiconiux daphne]